MVQRTLHTPTIKRCTEQMSGELLPTDTAPNDYNSQHGSRKDNRRSETIDDLPGETDMQVDDFKKPRVLLAQIGDSDYI